MADHKKTEADILKELSDDALRSIIRTRTGRRFLWELMGRCGLCLNPFAGQDHSATDFNCGRLSVATALLVDIDSLDSDVFSLMSREAKEDRNYARDITSVGSDGSNAGRNAGGDGVNAGVASDYDPVANV